MSLTEPQGPFTVVPGESSRNIAPPAPRRQAKRRWPWVAAAAAVVIAVSAGAAWTLLRPGGPDTSQAGPANHTPVVLPSALAGYAYDEQVDFATENWVEPVREEFFGDDHAFGGAAYMNRTAGGGLQTPQLNLVVVRGHFPDGGDLDLARPPWTTHGEVRCTHTFNTAMPGEPEAVQTNDGMTLCHRIGPELTVSVMAIGDAQKISEQQVAAAVEEAWALQ